MPKRKKTLSQFRAQVARHTAMMEAADGEDLTGHDSNLFEKSGPEFVKLEQELLAELDRKNGLISKALSNIDGLQDGCDYTDQKSIGAAVRKLYTALG